MKRNLFAIFLAVMLVAALVFVAAPNAKAAGPDYTFTEDGDSYTVNGDCIIDLAGFDVSINVSTDLEETPNVIVIDSKNLSDITGNSAGTLVVNGTCNIDAVTFDGNFRYLKVENTDDDNNTTYSFYPFNLAITKQGVNVLQNSISLEVRVMANSVVRDMITGFGIYQEVNGVKKYSSAKETFDGKNGVIAYFDLVGSLTSANAEKVWTPYIQIGEGDNTAIIDGTPKTISRTNILAHINNEYADYTGYTRTLAKALYRNNTDLRTQLDNLEGCITDGYVMVTDVNDLKIGDQIIIVAKASGYAMGAQSGNNCPAVSVVKDSLGDIANINNIQIITLEEGKTDGTFAFKVNAGYLYAASSGSNHLKAKTTLDDNGSWNIEIATNGIATIKSTGTYTRNWLRYNANNGSPIFSCYGDGQLDIAIYKLGDILVCDEHTGGEKTVSCTAPGTCTNCGAEYMEKLNCADTDNDHFCDNGCSNRLSECEDAGSDNVCDICGDSMNQGGIPEVLATFACGANGTATHADGSEKTSYTETVNGYTLSATNCAKFYTGARDAKGNSCIKLGTGSAAGSFTFKVPENVTSVNIYIAKYKTNTTKVSINNGAAQTLTKNSNNGEYDVITIDTSSVKTITVKTQSGGYRAMVNTIEFVGIAK